MTENKEGDDMSIGDTVWFRGRFADQFTIRGIVEEINGEQFGVRLENGNFHWADGSQLVRR